MTALVWFRNDLRIHDNPALAAACRDHEQVHALFLVTRRQWQKHDMAPVRERFMYEAVQALKKSLAALGITLQVRDAGDFANATAMTIAIASELGVSAVYFNREYELNEAQRDQEFQRTARESGINTFAFDDQCLIPPGQLLNQQGGFFRVYSPFRRAALKHLASLDLRPLPAPAKKHHAMHPVVEDDPWQPEATHATPLWPGSEQEARRRLSAFIESQVERYKGQRDFPALAATSTLSPYLAIGAISLRQCLHAALRETRGELEPAQEGLRTWINELLWREFYRHITWGFPETCRHKAFVPDTDLLPWRGPSSLFDAWCAGRTGYPLVDAAMRQLLDTGWMHNRLRMVTAMFLGKHLFTDWRLGERFFMQHLVDGDFSANNGGWQWSASTGADAAPYFRVFNPTLQSKRFDPDGTFIRSYLPELASLGTADIHEPSPLIAASVGYPERIVDHRRATDFVKTQFAQLGAMKSNTKATGHTSSPVSPQRTGHAHHTIRR